MSGWGKAFRLRVKQFRRERLENLARVAGMISVCMLTMLIAGFLLRSSAELELRTLETFYWIRGKIAPPPDIIIAALDDESYVQLKASVRWPFPRKFSAEVIERITKSDPKILIMDFSIPQEDQDPEANARLERAIRAGKVTMVSGLHATGNAYEVSTNRPANTFVTPSDPRFEQAAKMLLEMWVTTRFGTVSQITLNDFPDAPLKERTPLAFALNTLAGFQIPPPGPRELIKYYGPRGTIPRIPFYEILRADDETLRKTFAGKVVLAGLHSIEQGRDKMKDEFDVPVGGSMFGVEIHANIAGNLIENGWLRRMSFDNELSIVTVGTLLFALVGIFLSFRSCVIISNITVVAVAVGCYQAFAHHNFWLPFTAPAAVCAALTVFANQTVRYVIAEKKVRQSKELLDFET